MRKVMYRMSVSLDGFIEAANGDLSWGVPSPELHQHFNDREKETDVLLYGRGLYETMAAYWPTADQNPSAPEHEKEFARIWRSKPKIIFSTTLQHVEWNSRLFTGNIADEVNKLKEQPGQEMTVGGAGLASSFMQLDLIDEYWLYVYPLLLGRGKPMFGPLQHKIGLQLLETSMLGHGVILLKYARSGA
jgi:dihydrofolate reductase